MVGVVGRTIGDEFTTRVAMVLSVGALVHLLFGMEYLKALFFSLAYLFLMIPPPYVLIKEISYHLRMFDATCAAHMLQAMGIPVYRDAHFLHLPNITLEVADVCSGIASLFAMIALGSLYAHILHLNARLKLILIVGAVIFPVLANLFRIVLVSASVYYYGPVMLDAFFHRFTGTFTFLSSVFMLVCFGEFLRRIGGSVDSSSAVSPGRLPVTNEGRGRTDPTVLSVLFSPSLLLGIAACGFALYFSGSWQSVQSGGASLNLQKVPLQLGPYALSQEDWLDRYGDANAESAAWRVYERSHNKPIELFVGYRSRERGQLRLASPKLRLPEGWEYVRLESEDLKFQGSEAIHAD